MKNESRLQLLDCSLRDGGYYTHWDFPTPFVLEYLDRMSRLPVDYIEVGYRSVPKSGYFGAYFYTPRPILEILSQYSEKKLAIMLNVRDVDVSQLGNLLFPCKGIISLVRLAVASENLSETRVMVREIKKMGFEVAINLMYLSTWTADLSFISHLKIMESDLDYIYLVDSYGGSFPEQISDIISRIKNEINTPLGFHAHNNLELGLANTLAAISGGVQIVDSTVMGMGRGAGNLKTELLLTVLQKQGVLEVNFDELSKVVGLFSPLHENFQWRTNLAYMVSGANSLPQQQVMNQIEKRFYSLNSIVRGVHNRSKGVDDNLKLEEFKPSQEYSVALIVGGGYNGTLHSDAVLNFLAKYPDSCVIHTSSKNAAAYKEFSNIQFHCLVGNEGHRLESIYEILVGSQKMGVLAPYPRSMGTYVPPSLKDSSFQLKGGDFTVNNPESVTAIAIETALELKAERLFFVGYDGYEGRISHAEMELFKENESLFDLLTTQGRHFSALTPTKYSRLKQESVYSYL